MYMFKFNFSTNILVFPKFVHLCVFLRLKVTVGPQFCIPSSLENISIYVMMQRARAEGQGRSVAARDDKQGKMGRCLALCSALNCLGTAREPRDLQLSGETEAGRRS